MVASVYCAGMIRQYTQFSQIVPQAPEDGNEALDEFKAVSDELLII
jgi:hypothetical protein